MLTVDQYAYIRIAHRVYGKKIKELPLRRDLQEKIKRKVAGLSLQEQARVKVFIQKEFYEWLAAFDIADHQSGPRPANNP
jgi:hypothetical protein